MKTKKSHSEIVIYLKKKDKSEKAQIFPWYFKKKKKKKIVYLIN